MSYCTSGRWVTNGCSASRMEYLDVEYSKGPADDRVHFGSMGSMPWTLAPSTNVIRDSPLAAPE